MIPDAFTQRTERLARAADKLAAEVAARPERVIILSGPRGLGLTMAARRVRDHLPPITEEEAREVDAIWTAAGAVYLEEGVTAQQVGRPFRAPHHTISAIALSGGAAGRRGEVSLAHHGVLFLDDLPEFTIPCVQALAAAVRRGEVLGLAARPLKILMGVYEERVPLAPYTRARHMRMLTVVGRALAGHPEEGVPIPTCRLDVEELRQGGAE